MDCKNIYLLIVGSRTIDDYPYIKAYLNNIIRSRYHGCDITVVSGGARGVDSLAERWADENRYQKMIINADWDKYGKRAGYIRNEEMHRFISEKDERLVIAFWDGESRGTAQNFALAKKYKNELIIVNMDNEI